MFESFAKVTMADFITGETLCPITGDECPARQLLVNLYTPDGASLDTLLVRDDDPSHPYLDGMKLQLMLGENTATAHTIGCTGPEATSCPTSTHMNENQARSNFVSWFRSVRKRATS